MKKFKSSRMKAQEEGMLQLLYIRSSRRSLKQGENLFAGLLIHLRIIRTYDSELMTKDGNIGLKTPT